MRTARERHGNGNDTDDTGTAARRAALDQRPRPNTRPGTDGKPCADRRDQAGEDEVVPSCFRGDPESGGYVAMIARSRRRAVRSSALWLEPLEDRMLLAVSAVPAAPPTPAASQVVTSADASAQPDAEDTPDPNDGTDPGGQGVPDQGALGQVIALTGRSPVGPANVANQTSEQRLDQLESPATEAREIRSAKLLSAAREVEAMAVLYARDRDGLGRQTVAVAGPVNPTPPAG